MIDSARDYVAELSADRHAPLCDSSCYDCLRDYFNMPYHPLLDWRLARDLLAILGGFDIDAAQRHHQELALSQWFGAQFGGNARELQGDACAIEFDDVSIILTHALESASLDHLSARLADAVVEQEDRGFSATRGRRLILMDSFNLLRRPGWVWGQAHAG
jgi:hypothetical protein